MQGLFLALTAYTGTVETHSAQRPFGEAINMQDVQNVPGETFVNQRDATVSMYFSALLADEQMIVTCSADDDKSNATRIVL